MQAIIMQVTRSVQRWVRAAGPYLMVELVLPGGTLIALVLYLYRNGHLRRLDQAGAAMVGVLRAAARAFDQLALVWQPPAGPAAARPHRAPAGTWIGGLTAPG